MIFKYVLKNFRRRKVRTILMVLSLTVSTALIVTMMATVESIRRSSEDLVTSGIGQYDLSVRRSETSTEPFITVSETSQRILGADEQITAVYPRFSSEVELNAGSSQERAWLLAIDPAENIGQVDILSGEYRLGDKQAAVLQETALSLGDLQVGDTIEVTYSYLSREKGSVSSAGGSQRRAVGRFTISSIVRQRGVTSTGDGVIIHIKDAQEFLNLPDQAEELIVLVEPGIYNIGNSEEVALSVRDVAVRLQTALGQQYNYRLDKAQSLYETAQAFLIIQALITTYGLISLAVVGLLIYTLVMTNVQEQRREMAIIRILGSQRNLLFGIVVFEVIVIGIVGVSLGILLGQALTSFAVVPLIEYLLNQEGQSTTLQPVVSLTAILPVVISAAVVLLISAVKPAQDAANTKVVHAINPGVADNIQLEDLEQLRERSPNLKLFIIGLGMMLVMLMVFGLSLVESFGNVALTGAIILVAILMMVVGLVFVFFIFTRPLEKLILFLTGLVSPRLTYFAKRNLGRSTERNTLISMLVLFSAVLPSFLAAQNAIDFVNIETNTLLDMGAPVTIQVFNRYESEQFADLSYMSPSFLSENIQVIPGVENAVGLTQERRMPVSDVVGMRTGELNLVGVTGDLNAVLFKEMMIFSAGGPVALTQILNDPTAVIISRGMAEGLVVSLGGTIKVHGEGLDHEEVLTVVGIAQRLPGFEKIGRVRNQSLYGGTVLISMEGYQRLISDPGEAWPNPDSPSLNRVLAALSPEAKSESVQLALHEATDSKYTNWTRLVDLELQQAYVDQKIAQVLLLVLTLISFITAVFGVFAVIFVTIYARRGEIGMMKAVGARNWELNGMLSVESIAMTLSAALAGIIAGSSMAYIFAYVDNAGAQRPQQFAVDTTVMPFIIVLVVAASVLGTVLSARRIIKHKAVEILRMS